MADRPLRADARRNRDRVLAAADAAFGERGFGVPLDEIAAAAGVGPGTVYRHFPTKEALFEAVSLARVQDLVADAQARATATDPGSAFDGFLTRLAEEADRKRDLPDALAGAGARGMSDAVAELQAALDVLLARAQTAGAVRGDVTVPDLIALLKGLLQVVGTDSDPALGRRVFAVVRDGLRPQQG
ncbi:TetR/AcrR family transcriptional regulator [Pseudonocardia xinjiangensis]|uniref:TetR/AcrR family transcriptional regulator n=1 Tax=Pseudonocardia xinjiangensis TaxID=75289 RepID=UPI0028AAB16D|nr:helix-turn-helix domain-containing protein [Pseudonocardia xinjiangensis]